MLSCLHPIASPNGQYGRVALYRHLVCSVWGFATTYPEIEVVFSHLGSKTFIESQGLRISRCDIGIHLWLLLVLQRPPRWVL
jgi:hypothetical protein